MTDEMNAVIDILSAIGDEQRVVACYLGHCGATPQRYEVFSGSGGDCWDYIRETPRMRKVDRCQQCGGYTGTNPVKSQCHVETPRYYP
jgi:hypothetical protein